MVKNKNTAANQFAANPSIKTEIPARAKPNALASSLLIFPAGLSHIHRGRISNSETKTIATGWINAGNQTSYISRLAKI